MEKPKREQRGLLRGQIILLAVMMTTTTLVMAGAIALGGLAMRANNDTRQLLNNYKATQDKLPRPTQIVREMMVVTATPTPAMSAAQPTATVNGCVVAGVNTGGDNYCTNDIHHMQTIIIERDTTYRGESSARTLLSGDNTQQTIFVVNKGATLRLEDISIVNAAHIAIRVEEGGTLELKNCSIYGNGWAAKAQPDGYGGAIWNAGTLVMDNCVLDHNMTASGGAALYNSTTGTATIRNSWMQNSTSRAGTFSTGTAILNYGILTIENGYFNGNTSDLGSGAALASIDGDVTLTNTLFENNRSSAQGGAIYNAASMTASGLIIRFNVASEGGGIFNKGLLTLKGSYIDLNAGNCINQGQVDNPDGLCGAAQ